MKFSAMVLRSLSHGALLFVIFTLGLLTQACATTATAPTEIDRMGGPGWRVTDAIQFTEEGTELTEIMGEVNECLGTEASLEDVDMYVVSSILYAVGFHEWGWATGFYLGANRTSNNRNRIYIVDHPTRLPADLKATFVHELIHHAMEGLGHPQIDPFIERCGS